MASKILEPLKLKWIHFTSAPIMDEFDEEGDELMLSVDLPLVAQHNEHTAKIGLGDDKSSSHSRQFSSGAGSLVDKPESDVMDSVDGKI